MLFELVNSLFSKLGIIVLAAFILSRLNIFKYFILKEKLTKTDKVIFSVVFGIVGIVGTYSGIPIHGAIANSRSIGVIVAGLLGGPTVGIVAGLIAGIHRMVIVTGRFTAVACGISTIIGGFIAGLAKKKIDQKSRKWLWGAIVAFFIETIQMGIILLIAKPFEDALFLVKLIFIPMTFINSIGTGALILFIEQIFEEHERAGAVKAQLALNVATKTLAILRNGLNYISASKVAKIIRENTDVDAVALTDQTMILAHVGIGDDHHKNGRKIYTNITKKVIESGKYMVAQEKEKIECPAAGCKLGSSIVVPLKIKDQVIGTLKLYKKTENSISSYDIVLAKGLGHLFSTQIELSQIEHQRDLLQKAELKALQAQIQPHFLFNALNTIISFCRTDALKARDLLTKLSLFLRTSFKTNEEFIPFEQEIEHVKNYLDIEHARFSERLKVNYDIDNKINCLVPPLILQPVVENALIHGLKDKKQDGLLCISAKSKDDNVVIEVTDNGIGMSKEKVYDLLNKDQSNGIGVNNVNDRLLSIYKTSLQIDSSPNKGTRVKITLPNVGVI
ncbi:sensor histidine kinase [Mycoplasmatota bacterium]|nr:sensor histidine kinase [Mycoplasmatota bacterium]